jgi:NADPH:quinone reductase-like Zn-dependent oxidoreductase
MSNTYSISDGVLTRAHREAATPGVGEVSVKIHASSINYRDLGIQAGFYPSHGGVVPLSDGAGRVVAVGEGVKDLVLGDLVASCFYPFWAAGPATATNHSASLGCEIDGLLRTSATLPASAFIRAPDHLTAHEAATLPCAAVTAWAALLTRGGLIPGEHVLVQGTGGVAVFAVQFAKAMGATVTVISSSDEKLEKIRELGADYTVNYVEYPQWSDRVNELLGGEHIDLAIELGGAETLAQSLNSLRVGGRISVIGVLSGNEAQLVISDILRKWVSLNGITVSHREDFRAMNRFMASHDIKPVIDHEVSFENAETAYSEMSEGRHFGKIVIAHQ